VIFITVICISELRELHLGRSVSIFSRFVIASFGMCLFLNDWWKLFNIVLKSTSYDLLYLWIKILGELLRAPSVVRVSLLRVYLYYVYCCPKNHKSCDKKESMKFMCIKKKENVGAPFLCVNILFSILYRKMFRNV
jgi:hypothetical protein